ncbi:hypothetical protein DEU37_2113 [Microbacterium sp. AG790]|nr:hypothetical protein DEU37_2113 [Microbacterium sp. AG790]
MVRSSAETVIDIAGADGVRTAIAIVDGVIADIARDDVDAAVARWRGPQTDHLRLDGVAHPAFIDTHNHLMLTSANELGVPMAARRSIADIVDGIRERAATTPHGEWVVTAADWHESGIAEGRLPSAAELDAATADHPILVLRGGHNGSANGLALARAGIDASSPDIAGGIIARDGQRRPLGPLQDEALVAVQRLLPAPSEHDLVDGIDTVSARYRAHGIGVVRDAAVSVSDVAALRAAHRDGRLHVRTRAMILSPMSAIAAAGGIDAYLDALEAQGLHPDDGDDVLRVWGLKILLDGGVEAAALAEPFTDRPEFTGTLLGDTPATTEIVSACVRRGWRVGAHAMGERAIQTFLDAVDAARSARLVPAAGQVVIEHGALITGAQRRQARDAGVALTGQQALRDGLVGPFLHALGPDRVARMFPWRALVDDGVEISAGTDHPIGPLDPLQGIVGMTTRRTRAGVLGPDQAIERAEALSLYTTAGARLLGGGLTGALTVGSPADIVVWPVDLEAASAEDLAGMRPVASWVAGRR